MSSIKQFIFFLCTLGFPFLGFGQTFSLGAVIDPQLYDSLPRKAVQITRAYESLPARTSLKPYAPSPGDQGAYGTCTAWASAYAARTILESVTLNRRDPLQNSGNVFSPNFVYKSMFIFNNVPDDPTGQPGGAAIPWALIFLRDKGPVKMLEMERKTEFKLINLANFTGSRNYPIAEFSTLFSWNVQDPAQKIQMVKKSLAESKPVIIAMKVPGSFFSAREAWRPSESSTGNYGYHAMCVVGYDDAKYGGSFEVLNSWGESWGNGGFIWIPYSVFADFVKEAYDITENLGLYQSQTEYAGFAQIEVRGGPGMSVTFQEGYYRTVNPYHSGTRFRYLVGNRKPAYVYAFAADESSAPPVAIFPPAGVSPMLDYSENVVAFPGEFSWIQLDDRPGTDYLVVLYSKRALDLAGIQNRFAQEKGSFPERVAKAVGADYLPASQVRYEPNRLEFTAASMNANAVLGLLLAINHQ